jgi:hypothetical protein
MVLNCTSVLKLFSPDCTIFLLGVDVIMPGID